MRYTLDTNILINMVNRYPRDLFASLWESMEGAVASGEICVCEVILKELERGDDDLARWVNSDSSWGSAPSPCQATRHARAAPRLGAASSSDWSSSRGALAGRNEAPSRFSTFGTPESIRVTPGTGIGVPSGRVSSLVMSERVGVPTDRPGSRDFRRLHRDPAQLVSKDTRPRAHELETTSPLPGSTPFRAKNRFGRNTRRRDTWGAEERTRSIGIPITSWTF